MFELRDLEYFLKIVELRGFGRAATALGTTQPALSRRIAVLERDLGMRLFSRERRQIELTPFGEVFARESMGLLARAESVRQALREASGGAKERLAIGTRSSARHTVIMAAVRPFRAEHPHVSIVLSDPLRPLELDQLHKGEFDIAVMRGPVDLRNGLRGERLRGDPLVVALPEGHRLAAQADIDIGDLANEPFVEMALHRGFGTKALVRGVCADAGFLPGVVREVETVDMLVMCVAAGTGIALTYDASSELPTPGVVYRPLRAPRKILALYAVWRADDGNPLIAPFVRALKRAASALGEPAAADAQGTTRYGT